MGFTFNNDLIWIHVNRTLFEYISVVRSKLFCSLAGVLWFPSIIPKLNSFNIHLFQPSVTLFPRRPSSPLLVTLCRSESIQISARGLAKTKVWNPGCIVEWRCMEDWEFKVWQWLNSGLPWWPFQSSSAANLLKSFYSPLPPHKVPHQLWLDYMSLALCFCWVLLLTLSFFLSHTHTQTHSHGKPLESNRTSQSLPITPFLPPPVLTKDSHCLLWNPHCTLAPLFLDYIPSLFHKTDPS